MYPWKRIFKKLINPPLHILCVASVVIAGSLAIVFGMNFRRNPLSYIIYVLSAFLLVIWILRLVRAIQSGKKNLMRYRLINRYITDINFKAEISLYISLAINLLYSAYEAISGIVYHSVWFGTVAFYYMVLSVERFSLLNYMHKQSKNKIGIYRRYRFCGMLLIALNIAVCGMTVLVIRTGETATYPGHMIYAVAGYSFYNLISAIINVVTITKKAIRFMEPAKFYPCPQPYFPCFLCKMP